MFYYEILNSPDRACHLAKQVLTHHVVITHFRNKLLSTYPYYLHIFTVNNCFFGRTNLSHILFLINHPPLFLLRMFFLFERPSVCPHACPTISIPQLSLHAFLKSYHHTSYNLYHPPTQSPHPTLIVPSTHTLFLILTTTDHTFTHTHS